MPKRKTVCLCMIVKNEAHIIKETLSNMLPYIDTWAICDTGSTDGTQDIIINFFKEHNIEGEIFQHEWKDFGHNRTLALEAARDKADYSFVMDADDIFIGDFQLPKKLIADAYQVKIGKEFTYTRELVFKNSEKWRYRGVLHEYVVCTSKDNHSSVIIDGNYYMDSRRMGARSQDPEKYLKDGKILANAIEKGIDPDLKDRYAFYAGQSFLDYGDYENAIKYYQMRTKMGGFIDEIYYAHYKIAQSKQYLRRPINDVKKSYLDAYNTSPNRAEPLYELAAYYNENRQYEEAYLYAQKASSLPLPPANCLFLSVDIYKWMAKDQMAIAAFYLGKHEESFNICQDILEKNELSESDKMRIEENRNLCVPFLKDKYAEYPSTIINKICKNVKKCKNVKVIFSVTTCKRFDLFQKTMNSFINCCKDVMEINRWICVDDNSSKKDREKMKKLYPFFEFVLKSPEQKGHPQSMNIILDKINSAYLLHMEDDWHFFEKKNYIKPAIEILDNDKMIGQVCFNRNYAETLNDRDIPGGLVNYTKKSNFKYLIHEHYEDDTPEYHAFNEKHGYRPSNLYWPHYSLRPSLLRVETLNTIGTYNESAGHFEMEYAYRYKEKGYRTAFFDGICCLHTGRLTSERHDNNKKNAYELNEVDQFGEKKVVSKHTEFEGYVFYQNKDSLFNDIGHYDDSSLEDLKEICDKNTDAIGFNTYGFVKHKICPESEFVYLNNMYQHKYHQPDGLYIHKERYEKSLKKIAKQHEKKKLPPMEKEDFVFYPNKDSFGNDLIYHFSGDMNKMFEKCLEDKRCVGFNTYGYFKFHISDPNNFITLNDNYSIPYPQPDGLYVHKKRFKKYQKLKTVKIFTDWCSSRDIINNWNKMSKGNGNWDHFKLVSDDSKDADYSVIINKPQDNNIKFDPKRTIVFQMEPKRDNEPGTHGIKSWGKWASPDKKQFLQVRESYYFPNNLEWHLGKKLDDIQGPFIKKSSNTISAVITDKNYDIGHKLRIRFLKYLENKYEKENEISVDIYGDCQSLGFNNYQGKLPPHEKDFGIIPYKYHFACENNPETNYFTEKIVDAIMGESLCFYWGCPNIDTYLPEGCFIRLELDPDNFDKDYNIIKQAIDNNEWEKRLPIIREAKQRIMNELQFFPTLDRIISTHQSEIPLISTYFDRIFVTGIHENSEQWDSLEKKFKELNIDNYERITSGNDENSNHFNALQIGKEKEYNKILVISENVIIEKENIMKLNLAIQEIIDKQINWDILCLSGQEKYGNQIGHYIYQTDVLTLTNYAVNLRIYDKICDENKKESVLLEDIYKKCTSNIYQIYPNLIYSNNILNTSNNSIYNTHSMVMNMFKIKPVCINLERRPDRKEGIIKLMKNNNMEIPEFFKAVDGKTLPVTDEIRHMFEGNDFGNRRTFIGCAMSYYNLWNRLVKDPDYFSYFIIEDDIIIHPNFSVLVTKSFLVLMNEFQNWDMVLYGHLDKNLNGEIGIDYTGDSVSFIDFDPDNFTGGFYGYLINKRGAEKLLNFIKKNGIKHGIDYLIKKYYDELGMKILTADPLLIYSICVRDPNDNIDSDIQKDFTMLF